SVCALLAATELVATAGAVLAAAPLAEVAATAADVSPPFEGGAAVASLVATGGTAMTGGTSVFSSDSSAMVGTSSTAAVCNSSSVRLLGTLASSAFGRDSSSGGVSAEGLSATAVFVSAPFCSTGVSDLVSVGITADIGAIFFEAIALSSKLCGT